CLLVTRSLRITLEKRIPISRHRYRARTLPFKRRVSSLLERVHARGVYLPRRRQSIARQAEPLISSVINAVKIIKVRFNNRAKPVEIEVRITRQHRIPGPLDQLSSFTQCAFALRPLQTRADTFVLIIP